MKTYLTKTVGDMSAAQHPPGLYGRPNRRERDGATLSTVRCAAGDSDCAFPNCGCPAPAPAPDMSYGQMVRAAGGSWVGDTITFTPDALVRFCVIAKATGSAAA